MSEPRNPLTRATGYLFEGGAGLIGLQGAQDLAPSISTLLNVNMPLDSLNAVISTAMQLIITAVTLWRMIRPKKATLVVTDQLPAAVANIVPTPPPTLAQVEAGESAPGTEINPPFHK